MDEGHTPLGRLHSPISTAMACSQQLLRHGRYTALTKDRGADVAQVTSNGTSNFVELSEVSALLGLHIWFKKVCCSLVEVCVVASSRTRPWRSSYWHWQDAPQTWWCQRLRFEPSFFDQRWNLPTGSGLQRERRHSNNWSPWLVMELLWRVHSSAVLTHSLGANAQARVAEDLR